MAIPATCPHCGGEADMHYHVCPNCGRDINWHAAEDAEAERVSQLWLWIFLAMLVIGPCTYSVIVNFF